MQYQYSKVIPFLKTHTTNIYTNIVPLNALAAQTLLNASPYLCHIPFKIGLYTVTTRA